MDERRYSGDEIEEIFRSAASSSIPDQHAAPTSGLTLAELTAIGREVGIPSEQIVDAARRLDQRPVLSPRASLLGMPVSVGRSVDLPRAPTDREWSILVGELRHLFQTNGHESSTTHMKTWRNGNLHVVIEPTEAGYTLRMGTRKSDALPTISLGLFFLIFAVFLLFTIDGGSNEIVAAIFFTLMSAGAFSYNSIRLPRWASERDGQMAYFCDRTLKLLHPPAELQPPPSQVEGFGA
jgi:hypothetical protein